ncbi:MAG: 50S ribosomal protein L18 [Candidatus Competibacteraceae bacterium]|nr:50S ribosomal protein L18 [Candidatus Competibacteraceae bacterium]
MSFDKVARRQRIRYRVRKVVKGTAEKPRLAVFRSNSYIYAQAIDDQKGTTLFAASSLDKDIHSQKLSKSDEAKTVGKKIAEKLSAAGIAEVAFDRGGFLYHGRVKSLADGAREAGLKF